MRTYLMLLLALPLALPASAADLEARWNDRGVLESLGPADAPVAVGGELFVAAPGWKGGATQASAKDARTARDGDTTTTTGILQSPECDATFTQTMRRDGERVHVALQVEARRPFPVQAMMWHCRLSPAHAAGARWAVGLADEIRAGVLPKSKAVPYILGGGDSPVWLGWAGDKGGLRVTNEEGTIARCQVQDNRDHGGGDYEFQAYAAAPAELRPGQPVRLAFTLEAMSPAALAAEEAKMRPSQLSLKATGPLALRSVTPDRTEVPRYGKLELRLDLKATYDNPFDPEQIDVTAHFRSPSGKTLEVPGFLYRPYTRTLRGKAERLVPAGEPEWRVRFSPAEVGEYTYRVSARDRTGTVQSPPARFRAVKGGGHGFVRISKQSPRYFAFDDGTPYFAVGANVCWPGQAGTHDYDQWFAHYGDAGCNYARLWIGPFDLFTLERKPVEGQEDTGLGRYHLAGAWNLDYVTDLAEKQGIYLMFCIDSFNSLRFSDPYPAYANNPYSAANGGLLAKPEEFFTRDDARKPFRNRLRYLVARWGYSPHVLSWEFWNEVDIIEKYVSPEVRAWHAEMSRYLRGIDAWKHLQTTSFANSAGDATVDALPEMDYVQTHSYGLRDMAAGLPAWSRKKHAAFTKPHYVGEFGTGGDGSERRQDPEGICLHNGIWATVMSGDAGTAMLWWWDNYIEPLNLYHHFAALNAFIKGIDWPREKLAPMPDATVAFAHPPKHPATVAVALDRGPMLWSPSPVNQPNTFVVPRTGKVDGLDRLSGLQHGLRNHKELHNPATFEVDYARAGRFIVNVGGVSGHGGAALKVTLDGRTVLEKEFADPDDTEKTDTLNQYNGAYPIEVPAGKHTLVVENTGRDWFYASYTLPEYAEDWEPRLRVLGLAGDTLALAWVQHTDHTWAKCAEGVKRQPVSGAVLRLPALKPGAHRVELWDTYTGKPLRTIDSRADPSGLAITLPDIDRDVAVKVIRSR